MKRSVIALTLCSLIALAPSAASGDDLLMAVGLGVLDSAPAAPPEETSAGVRSDIAVPTPAPVDLTAPASATPTDPIPAVGKGVADVLPNVAPVPTSGGDLTVGEALGAAGDVVHAYRTGGWLAALAALVVFLTGLLRRPQFGALLDRLPKRARILVPLALGALAAFLASYAGGVPWLEAVVLAVLTGPTAVALHQGIARALLGRESPERQELRKVPVTFGR